jgi:hypothetical protein
VLPVVARQWVSVDNRLKMEEVAKKLEMGLDAQKSFAQVHEDNLMNK